MKLYKIEQAVAPEFYSVANETRTSQLGTSIRTSHTITYVADFSTDKFLVETD